MRIRFYGVRELLDRGDTDFCIGVQIVEGLRFGQLGLLTEEWMVGVRVDTSGKLLLSAQFKQVNARCLRSLISNPDRRSRLICLTGQVSFVDTTTSTSFTHSRTYF